MNSFFLFNLFGVLGIFGEIIFTSIIDSIKNKDPSLKGTSYLWMHPIYGMAGILINFLHTIFGSHFFLLRGTLYATYIMIGELIAGIFLKKFIGKCPWHYTSKYSVLNVVRLDYFPVWFTAGLLIEKILLFVNSL